MFLDTVLLLIGGVALLVMLVLVVFLLVTHRRAADIRRALRGTATADVYTETLRQLQTAEKAQAAATASSTADAATARRGLPEAERLPAGDPFATVLSDAAARSGGETVLLGGEQAAETALSGGDGTELLGGKVFDMSASGSGDGTELLGGQAFGASRDGSGESTVLLGEATERLHPQTERLLAEQNARHSVLRGHYELVREIHGGGMSEVYIARSVKLGNNWIVKYVPDEYGRLSGEENILKLLNHPNLPQIIDIYRGVGGIYLVESYIEGVTLETARKYLPVIPQSLLLSWTQELAEVLGYLHNLNPNPVFHLDMKPSNVMVTHNNRLVLIDFGVSKQVSSEDRDSVAVTYRYAAPEQLKHRVPPKYEELIAARFGQLPAERMSWTPDARTDIYGIGVILFEMITGEIPLTNNRQKLHRAVPGDFAALIDRCIAPNPDQRWQTTGELLAALEKVRGGQARAHRDVFARRLASAAAAVSVVVSAGCFGGGFYIRGQENLAYIDAVPDIVTVSRGQSSELTVTKQIPGGEIVLLDTSKIHWEFTKDNIARVDGGRIAGLNAGYTELSGLYRNKDVSLKVRVVEPLNGEIEIAQRYNEGAKVSLYAGSAFRDQLDGDLEDAEFTSPESIAVADDGTVYIADAGLLRIIRDEEVESLPFKIGDLILAPQLLRCLDDDVYILTDAWRDDDGYKYGLLRYSEASGLEGLYTADAQYSEIEDFALDEDGLMYFIDRNAGTGAVTLRMLDPEDPDDVQTLIKLDKGAAALAFGEDGDLYIANSETGVIELYSDDELSVFAGEPDQRAFVDGAAPLFYSPQRLQYYDGALYIWDFNVLRKLSVEKGVAREAVTVAGEASPDFDEELPKKPQAAEDAIFPNSLLAGFSVSEDGILVTDPKRGVIWEISM